MVPQEIVTSARREKFTRPIIIARSEKLIHRPNLGHVLISTSHGLFLDEAQKRSKLPVLLVGDAREIEVVEVPLPDLRRARATKVPSDAHGYLNKIHIGRGK